METKDKIVNEAMKLFSLKGFDAVSIREIASKVGIVNSALYKHFKSKKEILTEIVVRSKKMFLEECNKLDFNIKSSEDVKNICFTMFRYNNQNEWIVMFRKLLMIEQFKNKEMFDIYREFFIDQRINYQANFFNELMKKGIMKKNDPYALAMELYAPFYMYHLYEIDSDMELHLKNHIDNFFQNNLKEN